jgi:hypothetical protein
LYIRPPGKTVLFVPGAFAMAYQYEFVHVIRFFISGQKYENVAIFPTFGASQNLAQ